MNGPDSEVLVVRGELSRSGSFEPRYCYSTLVVREWPREVSDKYFLELVDASGRVLIREGVVLHEAPVCGGPPPQYWELRGYIALRPEAARLRLTSELGQIWEDAVGERARLELRFTAPRERASGARFELDYSPPRANGAYMQVTYLWGAHGGAILGQFDPVSTLPIDLTRLPGGPNCRFTVAYSDGLRAAARTTAGFELPPLGPELTIVKPPPSTELLPGQPLELEGHVVDRERDDPPNPQEELTWWLDETPIGKGPISGLLKPPPGKHTLHLRYAPSHHSASVDIVVRNKQQGVRPPADDWPR